MYADCVREIIDQLEKWTYQIYSATGLCSSELDQITETPMPTNGWQTFRPGQLASHSTCFDASPLTISVHIIVARDFPGAFITRLHFLPEYTMFPHENSTP